ncbi:MAG TPA: valine--tRNA ligase [Caldisericia bacterium]|nr:valine--tRNA ligase [Caldisericia bacterium]
MDLETVYSPKDIENEIYNFWIREKLFKAEIKKGVTPFTIVMPPPNVTGSLHLGHAYNSTIQDIMIRFKKMNGFESLWLPGVDHAGIATQIMVENELLKENLTKEKLGREEFLKRVWSWKEKYGDRIVNQQKRLGIYADWDKHRFTMDSDYQKAVIKAFIILYNDGLIYKGEYMINWCPVCKTALSDLEVEHIEEKTKLYFIRYPFKDEEGGIIIATTRPETMLGDTAVAVNPNDERYKKLIGKVLILPLIGREIPIISDSEVDMEFGTGAVKITPAHDPLDFEIGERNNLQKINILTLDGFINENGGKYKGLSRLEAREKVVEDLEKGGFLIEIKDYIHSIGIHDRCNKPIEPMISKQWFIKMKPLADLGLKAVREENIKIIPEKWEKVYENWLTNIKDWCISRQIWWGHRIPIYYCKNCNKMFASENEIKKCPDCGGEVERDPDVLDTWFSSALWPFATLGWPKETEDLKYFYPTSLLVTGYDILFFWVARMIMFGQYFIKKEPFKNVYIHGLIRDEKGRKMSKTLGNVMDPIEVIDEYGADATRFTFSQLSTLGGQDINLSIGRIKFSRNFMNKIWNSGRFVINFLKDFDKDKKIDLKLEKEDIWILSRLSKVSRLANELIDSYEFGEISNILYEFYWHEFCDWYIELSKLRDDETNKYVLFEVFINSLKLLHPFIPFITEKLYKLILSEEKTILLTNYPKENDFIFDGKIVEEFEIFMNINKIIRNLKSILNLPLKKKVKVYIEYDKEFLSYWKNKIELLSFCEIVDKKIEDLKNLTEIYKGAKIFVFLEKEYPIEERVNSLKNEITSLKKENENLVKRLENAEFMHKAPLEIIEETKKKRDENEERIKVLSIHLEELI